MAARNPNRQRRLKKKGNEWERQIEAENALLLERGLALAWRSNDAFRVVGTGTGNRVECIRSAKSEPDFHGVMVGGRAFCFDAKWTSKPRLGLPDPRKPDAGWWHQIVALSKHTAFGGIGFLYVLLHDDNPFAERRFVLPVMNDKVCELDLRLDRSIKLTEHPRALEVVRGRTWFDVVAESIEVWTG